MEKSILSSRQCFKTGADLVGTRGQYGDQFYLDNSHSD